MKGSGRKLINSRRQLNFAVIIAIALNVLLSFATVKLELPLYLDTIGTIFVTALAGVFPGLVTSVATTVFCSLFNHYSIYYTLIGVLIVFCTAWLVWEKRLDKKKKLPVYIVSLALIGGILGTVFQWILIGKPQFADVDMISRLLSNASGAGYFISAMIVNIGLNLVDKGVSSGIALLLYHIVPDDRKLAVWNCGWKQTPPEDDGEGVRKASGRHSLQRKITIMLGFAAASLTIVMFWISIKVYFENEKKVYTANAMNAASFAAQVIDADMVSEYLQKSGDVPGYEETRKMLYNIRDNSNGIEYLYAVKVEADGVYYVFDLDTEDVPAYSPGEKGEIEEAFEPYMPALLKGEEIPPVESDGISGWVMTVYKPVKNESGSTVCYACADVSMNYISGYAMDFLIKTLLIFSGFFILVLGYGMWVARYHLIAPIGSMREYTNDFIAESDSQKQMDNKVRAMRSLDIRTNDEVEDLYLAICKMATGIDEQMRAVRYYAEATAQMQNGLIITMADMVEDRDSDTGAHVQKTAAYVKIILNGLKEKGYYAAKLTPKYMSDVEMSAPLHDVGKINIPDGVLNKPGKLNDEEYEIMKTHTTAGKKIIEKAISTVQGENYLKEARNMAAYHHERWDGKGYPEGLHGEVIPLSARVMAVADVFDALASPRVYKPAFPFDKAVSIIKEGSGTQFDPKCVEVFLEHLTDVKIVLKKYQE